MTQQTKTATEAVSTLAGMEVECVSEDGCAYGIAMQYKCRTCQGTGTVARFAQLRVHMPLDKTCNESCSQCHGTSWLPVSLEKAGTELRKLPEFMWVEHRLAPMGKARDFQAIFEVQNGGVFNAEGPDADSATVLAALKWAQVTSNATN